MIIDNNTDQPDLKLFFCVSVKRCWAFFLAGFDSELFWTVMW